MAYAPINPKIVNGMYYGPIAQGGEAYYFCGACASDGKWVPLAEETDGGRTAMTCSKCHAYYTMPSKHP